MPNQRPRSGRLLPYRGGNRGNNKRGKKSNQWGNQHDSSQYGNMGQNNTWGNAMNAPRHVGPQSWGPVDYSMGNFQAPQNYQGSQNYQGPQSYQAQQNYQTPQNFQASQGFQGPQNYQSPQGYQTSQNYQEPQSYQAPHNKKGRLPAIPPIPPFDDGTNWENQQYSKSGNSYMFQGPGQDDWNNEPQGPDQNNWNIEQQGPAQNDWDIEPQRPPNNNWKNNSNPRQLKYRQPTTRGRLGHRQPKRGRFGPVRGAGRKPPANMDYSYGNPPRNQQSYFGHEEEWYDDALQYDEFVDDGSNYYNEDFYGEYHDNSETTHGPFDYGDEPQRHDRGFNNHRNRSGLRKDRPANQRSKPDIQNRTQKVNRTIKKKKEFTEEEKKLDRELSKINVQTKDRQTISSLIWKVMQAIHPVASALAKNAALSNNHATKSKNTCQDETSDANGDKNELDDDNTSTPDENLHKNAEEMIVDAEELLSADIQSKTNLENKDNEKENDTVVESTEKSAIPEKETEKTTVETVAQSEMEAAPVLEQSVIEKDEGVSEKSEEKEEKHPISACDAPPKSSSAEKNISATEPVNTTQEKPVQVLLGALTCGHAAVHLLFGKRFECCIIIISKHKPTQTLLTDTYQLLVKQFQSDFNLKKYYLVMDMGKETITVDNHNIEGLQLTLRFTSPEYSDSWKPFEKRSRVEEVESAPNDNLLDSAKCKEALSMIRRMRWYIKQRQDPSCQGDVLIIRLFIFLTMQEKWKKLPLWQVLVLVPQARKSIEFQLAHSKDKYASTTIEPKWLFQRCLEILSSGALYENWESIKDPVEKEMDVMSWLSNQDAEDITVAAMDTLRELSLKGLDHILSYKSD